MRFYRPAAFESPGGFYWATLGLLLPILHVLRLEAACPPSLRIRHLQAAALATGMVVQEQEFDGVLARNVALNGRDPRCTPPRGCLVVLL
jgi:hypothetical protein